MRLDQTDRLGALRVMHGQETVRMKRAEPPPRMTKRLLRAALRVGEINAGELQRTFRGLPAREHPPRLKAAYAELEAAKKAANRRR